jgi:sigma-E factor negative regulatory protein RseB
MRGVRALLAVAALSTLASPAASGGDAAAWLLQASDAARQSNYQGVVIYRDARMMEVLRVAHRNKGGQIQERLTSLTGQPRDILHDGDRAACFVANQPAGAAAGLPRSLLPAMSTETLAQAGQHYEFRELGETRIAGRTCRGVVMEPRDEFRYGYEICADSVTGVPLRVTLLDKGGRTVEQLLFTEVSFPAEIADAAFTLPAGAQRVSAAPATVPDESVASVPWELAQLPPGFRVILRSHKPDPAGGGVVEHVLLSDGLSAVSVFGVQNAAADPISGLSRMGAMNAYGRKVGAFSVTVVGEVPESTVRLIGDGFQPAPKAR